MNELKQYDEGAAAFLKNLKTTKMPLQSWDFYGAFFGSVLDNLSDQKEIFTIARDSNWVFTFGLPTITDTETVIVLTDENLKIVFSSSNILKMAGYRPNEIIGKNPNFFQGEATSKIVKAEIREAVRQRLPFEKTIVNYRKDGTPYNCEIKSFPVFNKKGALSHFIAFEKAA